MKKKIAVFTTGWCSEILSQFLSGVQKALKDSGTDLFLFLCYPTYVDKPSVKHGELNIFTLPDLKQFDGMIIFGSGLNFLTELEKLISRGKQAGIPIIIQGAHHDDTYYIGSDNYVATRDMCRHLQDKHGVRKIIFLAGTVDSFDSEFRLKAVKDHLDEAGHSEDLVEVFYTKWENALANKYISDYCKAGRPLPDAFICANDGLAMETCVSLNANGYKVPEDVIVTGFDFIDDSQIFDPSIASVDQCFEPMGHECGNLWLDLTSGITRDKSVVIPCEFIPGESCDCYDFRNSDKVRRRVGRENFSNRTMTNYFNRKLHLIDSTILSCLTYQEFKDDVNRLLTENHDYEGDSFHILLDPNFGLSIYDSNIKLRKNGYSNYVEVLYSTEDGKEYGEAQFRSRELIPGYNGEGPNHLYVFLPIHEADEAYGYLIFRDCLDKVANHFLQTYQNRMGLVLDKFRHSLSLDLLNKRLIELMRKDPLTNVNNRTAYEDKEKRLQSEINMESNLKFAIAMFDVNSLKLINDNRGHDAGDAYLVRACRLICNVFKHSPVYRIGGDEFVAVLDGGDYEKRDELMAEIRSRMNPYTDSMPLPLDYISIACGMAVFDPQNDRTVQDIVKRADEEMYKNKAEIKAG
ncbi:MAG: diguanylate cyclase [Lachnospiraceae bacterium]|nr:diguanylate cyclase [Lachnospiraceae bacterium]